jgi:5-methyltetrahydrofolate--homocysteine methyltransferase
LETILRGTASEITIGYGLPTVLIGNRIDAGRQGSVAEAIRRLDLARVQQEARAQADEGAEVIAVQVFAEGVDQERVLPAVVDAVAHAVPLPLCILTENPAALAAALQVCPGKPLVGSLSGKPVAIHELLPLAAARGAAVIATALDNAGIPPKYDDRIEMMRNILRAVILGGVARQDIILNPALLPLSEDPTAAATYLQAAAYLSRIEQLNMALEPDSAAPELAHADTVGQVLLALGVRAGVTCALADPSRHCGTSRVADFLLARREALERLRALPAGVGPSWPERRAHATT